MYNVLEKVLVIHLELQEVLKPISRLQKVIITSFAEIEPLKGFFSSQVTLAKLLLSKMCI